MSDRNQAGEDQPPPDVPVHGQPLGMSGGVELDAESVNIGGDVVARDKIVGGDEVTGDKVIGDKVLGDKQELRAEGRNILQIGRLNLPLGPLLIIGGVALAVIVFIGLGVARLNQSIAPTPTPGRMSATTFNVIVAEFGALDANDRAHLTDQSRALSQSVYDTLLAQRDAFPDPIIKSSIELRYGNLPVPGGLVLDETTAAKAVEQLGADILIYGNLAADGTFTPQFYISPQVRAQIDAALTGQQQLGTLSFVSNASFGASTDLRTRASFLFFIATGLAYDVFGHAARSLEIYRQAEQQLIDWPEQGAGKEVLYFFKGQAALFLAQQTTGQTSTDLLTEAESALNKATSSNPAYARARIALGSLHLIRLQRLADLATAIDSPDTAAMFDQYSQAATLAHQASDRQVEAIATLSLGAANYMLGGAYQFRGEADQANAAFDEAARLIEDSRSALADFKQPRLLAQADLALGAVYDQQAQLRASQKDQSGSRDRYQRAQQAYRQCVARGQNSADRILLDLIITQRCQPNLDKVDRLLQGGS